MRAILVLLLTSIGASAAEDKTDWKSLVDPATTPEKVEWPKDHKLNVEVSKSFFDPEVIFAEFGGPFSIVGLHSRGESKVVTDLRTGKNVATLKLELESAGMLSLSRDGKYYALAVGGRGWDHSVHVYEVATAKKLQEFGPFPVQMVQIAGERLLVQMDKSTNVYDIKTGKKLLNTDHESGGWGGHGKSSLTPGGKYLLDRSQEKYLVYDVQEGNKVFQFSLPEVEVTNQRQTRGNKVDGIAISPDGKKIGMTLFNGNTIQTVVLDLATGKELSRFNPPAYKNNFTAMRLNWSSDGAGLLHNGDAILDPNTGKAIYTLPTQGVSGYRMAESLGIGIVLDSTNRNSRRLVSVGLTQDKVALAKKAVETGGTAEDALRPDIIPTDRTKARTLAIPELGSDWNVRPDPAAPTLAGASPIRVPFRMQHLRAFLVSGGNSPVAVFEFAPNGGDVTKPRPVKRVDLRSGKVTAEFEFAPGLWIADVSPDGSHTATTDYGQGYKRLDIYPMDGKTKPYGFRPFPLETKGEHDTIIGTYFLSSDRILLVSEKGTISLFSLPEGSLQYSAQIPGLMAVAVSPNRRYLACVQNGMVRLLDTGTGQIAGELFPSFIQGVNQKTFLSFRHDGSELAAGIQHPRLGPVLVRWDLNTGKILGEDRFPHGLNLNIRPTYLSDSTVLVNFSWVYDVKRQATVWHLPLAGEGGFAWDRPDNRIWYAMSGTNQESFIHAVRFPDAETETIIADVIDGPGTVLKPETTVSMSFTITGGMSGEYKQRIQDAMTKQCQAQGLKVVNTGGEVTVKIAITERDTGDVLAFRNFGRFGGDTVPVLELTAQTTISYAGEKLWEPPASKFLTRGGFGFIRLQQNETVQQHVHRDMWNQTVMWAQNSGIPRYLAKTDNGVKVLPQTSALTTTGLLQSAPPGRRR